MNCLLRVAQQFIWPLLVNISFDCSSQRSAVIGSFDGWFQRALIRRSVRECHSDRLFLLAFQSTNSQWFLGTIDRIHTGLIPANYVQPVRTAVPSSITLRPQTPFNATVSRNKNSFSSLFLSLVRFLAPLVSCSFTSTTAATTASTSSCVEHSSIESSRRRTTHSVMIETFYCFGSFLCVSKAWLDWRFTKLVVPLEWRNKLLLF